MKAPEIAVLLKYIKMHATPESLCVSHHSKGVSKAQISFMMTEVENGYVQGLLYIAHSLVIGRKAERKACGTTVPHLCTKVSQ